ncbi:MAG: penicillin-binding transpeptidase domain-containing protein, partial [bacterium]|nr:penicillin-binding transpeptidase domain-containing protein [bacterium]
NPYFPDQKSVFRDWKAHGYVDMRRALAVSSDVYFYAVGGGYAGQKGLGIEKIEEYVRMFGFGRKTGLEFAQEKDGTIPTPEWKAKQFDGDPWRIGDTYNTAIGQYGFQITPLQAVTATAAIANNGKIVRPTLLRDGNKDRDYMFELPFSTENFKIVQEGMRAGVVEGTAKALDVAGLKVAGKTGTAELGAEKRYVNSWVIGYFPYESPKYAFAVVMERGPVKNLVGSSAVVSQLLNWITIYAPEYAR